MLVILAHAVLGQQRTLSLGQFEAATWAFPWSCGVPFAGEALGVGAL